MATRHLFPQLFVLMLLCASAVAGHNQGHGSNGNGDQGGHELGVGHGGGGANNGGGSNNGGNHDGGAGNGNGGGNGNDGCYTGPGNGNGQEKCDEDDLANCEPGNRHCDIQDGLTISRLSNLRFPSVVAGFSQVVAVSPGDSGAAVFTVTGEPCMRVQVEVVETIDVMLANGTSSTDTIEVRDFTLGGAVSGTGTGFIDCATGNLTNIRIGGTAQVSSINKESFYQGFLNLRAWYY